MAAALVIGPFTANATTPSSQPPVREVKAPLAPARPASASDSSASGSSASASAASGTLPTTTSAVGVYLSNWKNIQAIWTAPALDRQSKATHGPRIAQLHYSGNWNVNQVKDYSGFYIDESDGTKYDQPQDFTATGYLDQDGVLNGDYGTYKGAPVPVEMSRDFVMVPNEPFMVTRYTLTDPSATKSYKWDVLDQVRLGNTNARADVVGSYVSRNHTLYADMNLSGQYVVFLGAMQAPSSYQVGNDADCKASASGKSRSAAGAWCQFNGRGTLADNRSLSTPDMDLGFQDEVTIAPRSGQTLYFYMGIAPTLSAARADARVASGKTGADWYTTTAGDYTKWRGAREDDQHYRPGREHRLFAQPRRHKKLPEPRQRALPWVDQPWALRLQGLGPRLVVRRHGSRRIGSLRGG